jgi:predicted metalloprotease with PDZ domain
MLRLFLFSLLPLALVICVHSTPTTAQSTPARQGQRELKYALEPVLSENRLRFRVELQFRGDATGTTTLVLPNRWGGQQRLYQAVQNLQVVSTNSKLSDSAEPHVKVITHLPNQTLHVQYELLQDFAGTPKGTVRDYYRPLLQKDYFHWIGRSAWVRPAWDENEAVRVSLRWKNLPRAWTLANSFGANQKNQHFRATVEDFISAVFVGGDFRVHYIPVGGKPVYTAIRGSWQFSDAAFSEMVQSIIKVEREFWRDDSAPYYLVTLLSLEASSTSVNTGGTGATNAFANFATPNTGLDRFKQLLAHEYFHNWNSVRLGRLQEPDKLLYWFSEGFTDYYAYLMLLRARLISLDEYIERYNSWIREYYLSPVRTVNNQRVLQDFWNDDDVHDLPYRRGFLLATNWNALIRSNTGGRESLDDVMRDMLRAAQEGKRELTKELINQQIRRRAGQDLLPDIRRYIEEGALIAPDKNVFGSHVELEVVEVPMFDLGLDLETLRARKVIAGIKEGSAAYRAGLRNGQSVVRRSAINIGDATKPIEITIKEGEGERTINYYPISEKTVSVPQFKLHSGITDKERTETLSMLGAVSSGND